LFFSAGRVDLIQYIGHCSELQLKKMFLRFYPQASNRPELSEEFSKSATALDINLSAAQVQGYFMFFKHDPDSAVKNVEWFKQKQK